MTTTDSSVTCSGSLEYASEINLAAPAIHP